MIAMLQAEMCRPALPMLCCADLLVKTCKVADFFALESARSFFQSQSDRVFFRRCRYQLLQASVLEGSSVWQESE